MLESCASTSASPPREHLSYGKPHPVLLCYRPSSFHTIARTFFFSATAAREVIFTAVLASPYYASCCSPYSHLIVSCILIGEQDQKRQSRSEKRFHLFKHLLKIGNGICKGGWAMGGATGEGPVENLEAIRSIVFKESETLDEVRFQRISGYDFNRGVDFMSVLDSLISTGFQASNLGDAIAVVNEMLDWRLSHEKTEVDCSEGELDPAFRDSVRCKIFLGFTSNLVSSGVRDIIRFLLEHRMVDVVVTTAGGIEEDIIKCLAPTYRGNFSLPGAFLRSKGLNRIGNLLVPNDNYCRFESWINPILDQMLEEQSSKVHCDATIAFPVLVAATFARRLPDTTVIATNDQQHRSNQMIRVDS